MILITAGEAGAETAKAKLQGKVPPYYSLNVCRVTTGDHPQIVTHVNSSCFNGYHEINLQRFVLFNFLLFFLGTLFLRKLK